jgi:hypothetical protein
MTLTSPTPNHTVDEAPAAVPASNLAKSLSNRIVWASPAENLWVGTNGFDFAGMVEHVDEGFLLTNWCGETEGVFADLATAKLNLEPSHRAALRETQDLSGERLPAIARLAVLAGGLATGAAVIGWCLMLVQS